MQAIVYEFPAASIESEDSMATQPERIATLESTASTAKWVLGIFIPLVVGWGAFVTMNVIAMKQQLADGGNTKLVTELKTPKSPEQLQANLSTVIAQVRTARVDGKKPDEQKVKALAGALTEVAKRNPELPESWRAIATLVSYSTSDIGGTAQRPDCDITQKSHEIAPSELPSGAATLKQRGFVFRNCTLHMDHLPPGKLIKFMGEVHTPAPVYEELTAGDVALIFDCDVILTDSGIAESGILLFKAFNSRLQFQIEKTPQLRSQDLLLAAIQDPIQGQFTVKLPPSDLAATHS